MKNVKAMVLLMASTPSLLLTGCNQSQAEAAATKIFNDQGLALLQPARSYVAPAGLVILPKSAGPAYLDPLDSAATENGTAVNFSAIIAAQSSSQSTALSVALSLVAKIIPLPIGLGVKTDSTVKLDQVNSNGSRLKTGDLETLVKMGANTKAALHSALDPNDGTRAFVVQEVYSAKSLSISTTGGGNLDVYLGSSGTLPQCGASSSSSSGGTSGSSGGAGSTSSGTAAGSGSRSTSSSGASSSSSGSTGSVGDLESLSIGACRATSSSLSFTSADYIPYAVRLAEIISVTDSSGNKTLKVKYGTFKFPSSLGNSPVEKATAQLKDSKLEGLKHINRLAQ